MPCPNDTIALDANNSTLTLQDISTPDTNPMPVLPMLPKPPGPFERIVVVNIRKTPFRIHKSYLLQHSPFFAAAFEDERPFIESQTQEMTIKDVSPRTFSRMVNWLYTQDITDGEGKPPSCRMLVDLWILGDRFMMPTLQNCAMEALNKARLDGRGFSEGVIKRVYGNTSAGSPLRMYAVDCYVKDEEGSLRDSDPPEFLVDVVNELKGLVRAGKKRKLVKELKDGKEVKEGEGNVKWEPSAKRMKVYHVKEDVAFRRRSPGLD